MHDAEVKNALWVAALIVALACSACAAHDEPRVLPVEEGASVSQLVVEVHIPLTPTPGQSEDEYQYPWIMEVDDRTAELDLDSDGAEAYDDGESLGDDYVYFLTGDDRAAVLAAAKRIATGPGVPTGGFVIVNTGDGDMGVGERVELDSIA